jgi:hypothetical protein
MKDLYEVEDALIMAGLDLQDEGDDSLLKLSRRVSRQIEKWDQDPCSEESVEGWDGAALAEAPKRLIKLAAQLPEPFGERLRIFVEARVAEENR